jgi:hypothetical protein
MTGRLLLAAFFVVAGLLHFAFPHTYIRMVPRFFPGPARLSGSAVPPKSSVGLGCSCRHGAALPLGD